MKNLKNTLIISSYVLLVALFFGGGFAIGRIGMESSDTSSVPEPTVYAVETAGENVIQAPVYEVIIEDGVLKINICIGDDKTTVASEEISEDIFPASDMEELKEGVVFERLEQAQQMFENFVS